ALPIDNRRLARSRPLVRSFGSLLRFAKQSPFAASQAAQVSRLSICATPNSYRTCDKVWERRVKASAVPEGSFEHRADAVGTARRRLARCAGAEKDHRRVFRGQGFCKRLDQSDVSEHDFVGLINRVNGVNQSACAGRVWIAYDDRAF